MTGSSSANSAAAIKPETLNGNRPVSTEVKPKSSTAPDRVASLEEKAGQSNNSRQLLVSGITIKKSAEGALISWEPPLSTAAAVELIEYSVWLIGKRSSLLRVYCGTSAQCIVSNASLSCAHIDTTSKPAIIFRIAAKNGEDYGTGTKVR